jgi:hypothetical protein
VKRKRGLPIVDGFAWVAVIVLLIPLLVQTASAFATLIEYYWSE